MKNLKQLKSNNEKIKIYISSLFLVTNSLSKIKKVSKQLNQVFHLKLELLQSLIAEWCNLEVCGMLLNQN